MEWMLLPVQYATQGIGAEKIDGGRDDTGEHFCM